MHRTSRTHTSDDLGHGLSEIVAHLMRTRGFHWPISLAVIDQQGEMLLLTIKPDWAGIPCTIRLGKAACTCRSTRQST